MKRRKRQERSETSHLRSRPEAEPDQRGVPPRPPGARVAGAAARPAARAPTACRSATSRVALCCESAADTRDRPQAR